MVRQFVGMAGHDVLYPCKIVGEWNGFAVPLFTAETIYLFIMNQPEGDDYDKWVLLDAGDLIVSTPNDDGVKEVISPENGMYNVGLGYCWLPFEVTDKGRSYVIKSACGRKAVIYDSSFLEIWTDEQMGSMDSLDVMFLAEWLEGNAYGVFVTKGGDRIQKL